MSSWKFIYELQINMSKDKCSLKEWRMNGRKAE